MHELFLKKILKTLQMNSARAGKKEGGWGEGIFARPRFPPLLFSPPQFFVFRFTKCAARKEVVFAPPTRAHTTDLLPKNLF